MDFDTYLVVIKALLNKEHERLGTWDKVAEKYDMPKGTLWRICQDPDYCPRWLRRHIQSMIRNHRDLFAIPTDVLKAKLDNRETIS